MHGGGFVPGPWLCRRVFALEEPGEVVMAVEDSHSRRVALLRGFDDVEATARLVTAAPDLLDASRAALELLRELPLELRTPAVVDREGDLVAAIGAALGPHVVRCELCWASLAERQG